MPRYTVQLQCVYNVTVGLEADSEDDAKNRVLASNHPQFVFYDESFAYVLPGAEITVELDEPDFNYPKD